MTSAPPGPLTPPQQDQHYEPSATRGQRRVWEQHFPWEGQRLMELLSALRLAHQPHHVLAYVSESPQTRAALRTSIVRAAGPGCAARVRSAYKTAYFWITEEVQPLWRRAQADRVTLTYPVLSEAPQGRFLQEAYPLAAVFEREGVEAEFVPGPVGRPYYQATLWRGERELWHGTCFTPLFQRQAPDGRMVLGPTGWLTVQAEGADVLDQRLETDGEAFWDWYVATVLPAVLELADRRDDGLVFRNLAVTLQLSEPDLALDVLDERISMTEALTEEVYFGTVDALKRHTSTPPGARTLTPGRIVPVAHAVPGQDGWARVTLTEWASSPAELHRPGASHSVTADPESVLQDRPAPPGQIWANARAAADRHQLEWHVPAHSVDGRPVPAVLRSTPGAAGSVLITAGQHANETTGPVAALNLLSHLAGMPVNFALLPLENPDGAFLHRALTQLAPNHMHHAARYTSLGDDLEARLRQGDRRWEAGARAWAQEQVGANLHLNLHGYPAHEWVRPYSGYAPHGFESWALPAGFITIVWYWPGHDKPARLLAEAIAQRLQQEPEVVQHAQAALRASTAHVLTPHYELIGGLPFILTEQPSALCPLTVITEAPDETIYGARFRSCVQAHLSVCLAAIGHTLRGDGQPESCT
ncbi:M14 family zinc carboxypeptidase [Deinococcus deserti]|uniref:Putative zinc carboxypeptidase n=1 Tax=Deinococcus deserti (strain DSM 17065 / CIP 109153 / LMG 22923 / VCD115) TaxID=546414 RepID=C1D3D7_DEIDV|nr:M14 family zinc carboxypeptidase [Deinococcus deserti]ACO48016.2 putative zinc carboxypeptidase [Deinococcus deserti VCD115]